MRALLITILVLTTAVLLPAQVSEHSVQEGKSVYVKGTRLTIKFIEIVEDSRCPEGVNCIWAGNARIRLKVTKGKSHSKVILLNSGIEPTSVTVFGYELRLAGLDPYPVRDKFETEPSIARISVKKVR